MKKKTILIIVVLVVLGIATYLADTIFQRTGNNGATNVLQVETGKEKAGIVVVTPMQPVNGQNNAAKMMKTPTAPMPSSK